MEKFGAWFVYFAKELIEMGETINWRAESFDSERDNLIKFVRWLSTIEVLKAHGEYAVDETIFSRYYEMHEFRRPVMDRFVLFQHPKDDYRIRVHRFKEKNATGSMKYHIHIHSHKWNFISLCLDGEYTEERYCLNSGAAVPISLDVGSKVVSKVIQGSIQLGDTKMAHRTIPHDSMHCLTLFIRGPAIGTSHYFENNLPVRTADQSTMIKNCSLQATTGNMNFPW